MKEGKPLSRIENQYLTRIKKTVPGLRDTDGKKPPCKVYKEINGVIKLIRTE